VPSLLRGFSAPVRLRYAYTEQQLTFLLAHDSDAFNRWEAGQWLALNILLRGIADHQKGRAEEVPQSFVDAFARVLADSARDPAFAAEALSLPSEDYLAEQMDVIDPDAIHAVRVGVRKQLAQALQEDLLRLYGTQTIDGPYSPDAASAGRRALRNLCLGYLMELESTQSRALAVAQLRANNMTDAMAALSTIANFDSPERGRALDAFYARWKDEALVVDKWFGVQATARLPATLAEVQRLMQHPAFELRNPNKVRALIGAFCHSNQVRFHAADGSGYAFLAEQIIALDPLNPQVAARLVRSLDRWKKFDAQRQAHARSALESVRGTSGLSRDTYEIVTRALA
jgi:aminopeptidase N